jgi:DeoR/GlpR family transcriptional regulator of sugar metabolism
MFDHERQLKILKILEENASVRVTELSEMFGVSEATIRRDLDKLHERGQILRIHGGAVLVERATPEPPVIQRTAECNDEKRRIGVLAASLIQDGDTVFIGSGTTTLEVARNLVSRKELTVITNALPVINTLAQQEGICVIATGGLLRLSELSFIGHLTEQALHELRPHKVVMGIRAINLEDGLTNEYLPEVSTDRVIIQSAPEVILVADHTKFGKVSTALVAPITAISILVTDKDIPETTYATLNDLGIKVFLA